MPAIRRSWTRRSRYYQERLKQTPEALAYLARRGLDDAELIERHRLGFADRTLGLRLPEKTRKAGHEIRSRLQKLGLLRDSGHEHFNGSIVIPVISPSGEITEVYGRKINDNLRDGTPLSPVPAGSASGRVERGGARRPTQKSSCAKR